MSSTVTTTTATAAGSPSPLKRKASQDALPAIATNTIMITNNYSSGKDGLAPTSSTTTATSNSSKITILAAHSADGATSPRHGRPMVVDQINICINNHFSGDAPAALVTTTTASATAKLPELIKIQKKKTVTGPPTAMLLDAEPKLGYEADVKQEVMDVEPQLRAFKIKKEPMDCDDELAVDEEKKNQKMDSQTVAREKQVPASAAIELKFSIGEEVLVPRKALDESCFYLGILTVIREDQCLVQFEDGSNCWTGAREMRRLIRTPNSVYCVLCKTRELLQSAASDTTHECPRCARAYHKECLQRALAQQQEEQREEAAKMNCLR